MVQTGGGDHLGEGLNGVAMKVIHPLRLVLHDQRPLASGILRGDADRATVRVARRISLKNGGLPRGWSHVAATS